MTPDTQKALEILKEELEKKEKREPLSFYEFLELVKEEPRRILRNIFQLFHDMVKSYVGDGVDEYPDDPESIGFVRYDCSKLLEMGTDNPFFADRLFSNRFIRQVEGLRQGLQQNRIYIFEGPPGCGKSTFLNNLLKKFEEYTETKPGQGFEILWVLDENLIQSSLRKESAAAGNPRSSKLEVMCPSRDHPLLLIPKKYRVQVLDQLLANSEIKHRIANEKEYEWLFREEVCTICKSLFTVLFDKLGSLKQVLDMVKVRPLKFDRRLGEGISIFNPGDEPTDKTFLTNAWLQRKLSTVFGTGNSVNYVFSWLARSNNGIYALMDIKFHNKERLLALHNVISEGVHKVDGIEERVNSLFLALMNPEDKKDVKNEQKVESFQERIQYIKIPYVMEPQTEVKIYRSIFGIHIDDYFLPRVLENFARVIISSRLNNESPVLSKWIADLKKYKKYCDEHGRLLRMEIYSGVIPSWLSEEDKRNFTAAKRRRLIVEAEKEGEKGFSGRDSIRMFGDFLKRYGGRGNLIDMENVCEFFKRQIARERRDEFIPKEFLGSLLSWYDFLVLNEIKEALYFYNTEQITEDILNFLCAVNHELNSVIDCAYTGKKIEITKEFFALMAQLITGEHMNETQVMNFARKIQQHYVIVMAQEIGGQKNLSITETKFYQELYNAYIRNVKEKSFQPFLKSENFQAAVKAYQTEVFETFDNRTKEHVKHMINSLMKKFGYTEQGAKEICLYVINNELAEKFS